MTSRDGALTTGLALRLALGDLLAQPVRTTMTVLVLTPLAASWFLLAAVGGSLGELGQAGQEMNLVVTEPDVFDLANVSLGTDDLARAKQASGDSAASVTPLVMRLIDADDRVLQLRAAHTDSWAPVHGLTLLSGRLPRDDRDEMAITQAVRSATGWQIGDGQQIFGTSLTITGVLRGSGSKVASLWLPLARAEQLFERPGEYQFIVVRLDGTADGDAVREQLRDAMPEHLVIEESAITAEATRGLRSLGELARVFTGVGIVGLAVGSAHGTALALAERGRSVALLRVMGFAPAAVRRLLGAQALLTTVAALVIGLAISWPIIAGRSSFVLRSFTVEPRLDLVTLLIGCGVSLACSWLGAVLASRRPLAVPTASLLRR